MYLFVFDHLTQTEFVVKLKPILKLTQLIFSIQLKISGKTLLCLLRKNLDLTWQNVDRAQPTQNFGTLLTYVAENHQKTLVIVIVASSYTDNLILAYVI